jgi:hypothetical protein
MYKSERGNTEEHVFLGNLLAPAGRTLSGGIRRRAYKAHEASRLGSSKSVFR